MKTRRAFTRGIAAVGAAVLAFIGLAPGAMADSGWSTTVDVTAAGESGLELTVSGSGYVDLPKSSTGGDPAGVYAALRDKNTMSDEQINAEQGIVPAVAYVPVISGGNWSANLTAQADKLERDADYEVVVWVAHGNITAESRVDTVSVELSDGQKDALFGEQAAPEQEPEPEPAPEHEPESEPVPVPRPEQAPEPTDGPESAPERSAKVEVVGATDEKASIKVSGEGFTELPEATNGKPGVGIYAGLRDRSMSYADITEDTTILPAVDFIYSGMMTDGAFETVLEAPADKLQKDGEYEVILWTAHGNPTKDTVLGTFAVTFTDEQRAVLFGPERSVAVDIKANEDGLKLDVSGEGFTDLPKASSGKDSAGVYAALRDKKTMSYEQINTDTSIVYAVSFVWGGLIKDGAWSTTMGADAADLDPEADLELVVWVAHGDITPDTLLETRAVELTDAQKATIFGEDQGSSNPGKPSDSKPEKTPAPKPTKKPQATPKNPASEKKAEPVVVCTTETVPGTAGTPRMSWGVKSSFTTYIQGSIAQGEIRTSNGAARSGATFTWGAGSGSLSSNGQGTLRFPGVVHFTGHHGVLNTTFSNMRVQVNAGGTGALIADVKSQDANGNDASGSGVTVANLRFLNVGTSGGTASATLTAAGARGLGNFYNPGDAMDSVRISFAGATGPTTEEVCYDADGNRVNADGSTYTAGFGGAGGAGLATTGAETTSAGLIAAGAILLGMALLAVRGLNSRRNSPRAGVGR